jgi:peptidoglycan/LPS O-acetylase OafA/YrhL
MGTVRFLLATCVVVSHTPSNVLFGVPLLSAITAVQAFYIISGFLITMILNERPEYRSRMNFYLSRYLRLWPPYIVVALLALCFYQWDAEFSTLPQMEIRTVSFVWLSNMTLLFQDLFLFLRQDSGVLSFTGDFGTAPQPWIMSFMLVPQCWTLGVEMAFYLVAPFLCRRRWGVAGLFLFGLAVRMIIAAWQPPAHDPWLYRFSLRK